MTCQRSTSSRARSQACKKLITASKVSSLPSLTGTWRPHNRYFDDDESPIQLSSIATDQRRNGTKRTSGDHRIHQTAVSFREISTTRRLHTCRLEPGRGYGLRTRRPNAWRHHITRTGKYRPSRAVHSRNRSTPASSPRRSNRTTSFPHPLGPRMRCSWSGTPLPHPQK